MWLINQCFYIEIMHHWNNHINQYQSTFSLKVGQSKDRRTSHKIVRSFQEAISLCDKFKDPAREAPLKSANLLRGLWCDFSDKLITVTFNTSNEYMV